MSLYNPNSLRLLDSWASSIFTAAPGEVFYFRTRMLGDENRTYLDLEPIDSDQGKFLTAAYPPSMAHPNK